MDAARIKPTKLKNQKAYMRGKLEAGQDAHIEHPTSHWHNNSRFPEKSGIQNDDVNLQDKPWQYGCCEHTWHSQHHRRHAAGTCGWTRYSRNAPSARAEHRGTDE
jgi:hypothetical protein